MQTSTGAEVYTGYHGAVAFSRESNGFYVESGSDSTTLRGSDMSPLVSYRRVDGEGVDGWYALPDAQRHRLYMRIERISSLYETPARFEIISEVSRPDGSGGWTVEHHYETETNSIATETYNRVVLGVQGPPGGILVDRVTVKRYHQYGMYHQLLTAIDDGFDDGGYTDGADEDDASWTAVQGGLNLSVGDDESLGGKALAVSPSSRTEEPLALQASFEAEHLGLPNEYVELTVEFRLANARVDFANRLSWGLYGDVAGYHETVFAGGADGPHPVDPVNWIGADDLPAGDLEEALPVLAGAEGRELGTRSWTAGEQAPSGIARIADGDWHQVSFTVSRVTGEMFTVTQSMDGRTLSAAEMSPNSHTLDMAVLGYTGAGQAQWVDEVVVSGIVSGQPVTLATDSFTDGGRDDGSDSVDLAWYSAAAGIGLGVAEASGNPALRIDWPAAAKGTPAAVVARFPIGSLNGNGDYVTLSYRTRLDVLTDGVDNRLFSGLADSRPEPHSLRYQPELADNGWKLTEPLTPLRKGGEDLGAFHGIAGTIAGRWDILHRYRHDSTPAMGAAEYLTETNTADGAGRLKTCDFSGAKDTYRYDSEGRLTRFESNHGDEPVTVTYRYDYAGRRVDMTAGDAAWRFVYDGDDVVYEGVDEDSDGELDRERLYWLLPGIDRRLGFVDIAGGQASFYYYLTDQVGTVLQVIDDAGNVVNQYDYDTFGNLRPEHSFETVENRYRFQGREWNEFGGHYYYRYRIYLPEWGSFAGTDMELRMEGEGVGSYLFCGNSPLVYADPMGLKIAHFEWRFSDDPIEDTSLHWGASIGKIGGQRTVWVLERRELEAIAALTRHRDWIWSLIHQMQGIETIAQPPEFRKVLAEHRVTLEGLRSKEAELTEAIIAILYYQPSGSAAEGTTQSALDNLSKVKQLLLELTSAEATMAWVVFPAATHVVARSLDLIPVGDTVLNGARGAGAAEGALEPVAANGAPASETFYRTMSKADYDTLLRTGKLPGTSETFTSSTRAFSEGYDGVLVEFRAKPGTTQALSEIGVRDASATARQAYPDMPVVSKGWTAESAFFKGEGQQINIGLGQGKALDLFNGNIEGFQVLSQ